MRAVAKPISRSRSRSAISSRRSAVFSAPREGAADDRAHSRRRRCPGQCQAARGAGFRLNISMSSPPPSGQEALEICERAECDIVLLDVMMPDMDGFEVCRRLKRGPATHHIPVVMVTALDQPSDRVKGLDSGADDFLTKPVSDVALIARVRSLSRLKMMTDELRMRAVSSREIGIESPEREALAEAGRNGRILMVDDRPALSERIARPAVGRAFCGARGRPERGAVSCRGRQLRSPDRFARSRQFRRTSALQPDPLARAHPQSADPGHRRSRRQHAADARRSRSA